MSTPQPAEVLFLPELHQSYQLYGISSIMNKFIRITGRIVHIDYSQRFCIIEDDKYHLKLMIEISLLDFNLLKLAEIHQFIGTIDAMENPPMVRKFNFFLTSLSHSTCSAGKV